MHNVHSKSHLTAIQTFLKDFKSGGVQKVTLITMPLTLPAAAAEAPAAGAGLGQRREPTGATAVARSRAHTHGGARVPLGVSQPTPWTHLVSHQNQAFGVIKSTL